MSGSPNRINESAGNHPFAEGAANPSGFGRAVRWGFRMIVPILSIAAVGSLVYHFLDDADGSKDADHDHSALGSSSTAIANIAQDTLLLAGGLLPNLTLLGAIGAHHRVMENPFLKAKENEDDFELNTAIWSNEEEEEESYDWDDATWGESENESYDLKSHAAAKVKPQKKDMFDDLDWDDASWIESDEEDFDLSAAEEEEESYDWDDATWGESENESYDLKSHAAAKVKPEKKDMFDDLDWDDATWGESENESYDLKSHAAAKVKPEKKNMFDDLDWDDASWIESDEEDFDLSAVEEEVTEIRLVTGYKSGNKERDAMSKLVIESQRAYAARYGYSYEVFTENLAKQCKNLDGTFRECEPQWNKIAIIQNWLNEPIQNRSHKEHWLVWLDDDMPITNPNYHLENIIGQLRKDEKTSLIVTTDPQVWHRLKNTSINTGALFVRHTAESKQIFNAVWEARLEGSQGFTLGTCPNQRCLHEQHALADFISKIGSSDPLNAAISVVHPRTAGIGVNTLAREDGYDHIHPDGTRSVVIFRNDEKTSRWEKGDFAGQCSGLPVKGYQHGQTNFYGIPQNIRLECIRKLIRLAMPVFEQN